MRANITADLGVASAATIAVGISFRDRDGNRAKATSYCPFAMPADDAWAYAFAIGDLMQALSDAVLFKIDLTWRWQIDDPALPSIDVDFDRKILLLITNEDDEINGITIPSPKDIWETSGPYAGIRLDLTSAGALGFAGALLAFDLRTHDNRAIGIELVTGGLTI